MASTDSAMARMQAGSSTLNGPYCEHAPDDNIASRSTCVALPGISNVGTSQFSPRTKVLQEPSAFLCVAMECTMVFCTRTVLPTFCFGWRACPEGRPSGSRWVVPSQRWATPTAVKRGSPGAHDLRQINMVTNIALKPACCKRTMNLVNRHLALRTTCTPGQPTLVAMLGKWANLHNIIAAVELEAIADELKRRSLATPSRPLNQGNVAAAPSSLVGRVAATTQRKNGSEIK